MCFSEEREEPYPDVFMVTFPMLDHPGRTYIVVLDRGDDYAIDEDGAKDKVISEIENCDEEESQDYPPDLDMDPANVTCRRMTHTEAVDLANSAEGNCSWWG